MGRVIQEFKSEPIDDIVKFYEKDVENCIEGLEREPEREVMVRCFLPQKKKEQEEGNYKVSYEYSEIIYVQVKVPECIQLILAILTTDGELKIMIQKSVKTNIDSITWEQSCQFLKFYDQRDLNVYAVSVTTHILIAIPSNSGLKIKIFCTFQMRMTCNKQICDCLVKITKNHD